MPTATSSCAAARTPNYAAAEVDAACAVLRAAGQREQVMIDFSHANSRKDHRRQIEVGHDVAAQIAAGEQRISGVMIESHLQPGRQDLQPGRAPTPGVSITDACLGWDDSAALLRAAGPCSATKARRCAMSPCRTPIGLAASRSLR